MKDVIGTVFVIPDLAVDANVGEQTDLLATVKVHEDGKVELLALDGIAVGKPVEAEIEEEDEEMGEEAGMQAMIARMATDLEGGA